MQTNKEIKVKNKKGTNEQKQTNVEKRINIMASRTILVKHQIDRYWRKNGKV